MENDYIDFNEIKKYVGITDEILFLKYLKEVYKDLASRKDETKKNGIAKQTFLDYIKLPIFISEKVFNALDLDHDSFLNPKEFIKGMKRLYNGNFEESLEIVFSLLDFNSDKIIEKEDVKLLLSYLPLKSDKSKIEYKYQMESLNEIDEITSTTFNNKNKLTFEEFKSIIENKKSDVFLQILCFLYQKKPFTEENIKVLKNSKKNLPVELMTPDPNKLINNKDSIEKKFLISPKKSTCLSPVSNIIKNKLQTKFELNSNNDKNESSGFSDMVRFHNEVLIKKGQHYDENSNINDILKDGETGYQSPTNILKGRKKKIPEFNLESNLVELNINNDKKLKENKKEEEEKNKILYEDYIYKFSDNIKLKKFFLVLIGQDIFYYKNEQKTELFGMHNLSGCFVKDNGTKIYNGKTFYSFSIVFPSRSRNFFCLTKQTCDNFIFNLKKSFGYLNFFDYYEMLDDLGEGIFGVVKLGLYKKTKERVAIKIIKKEKAKQNDIELVRTEIDIMKLCRHPNIVKLLDHFENAEYIFIVMEYIPGGDLGEYMKKNKYNFTEKQASVFIKQIALGLNYLHQFGIIHRDLKPENIMLTEKNENGKVKIMDFGLSKILGNQEKSVDGFGTLTFVAPEVLVRTPYNKEIDIWSLGVILYLMLSGLLPFDDENDNEEVIAKLIVYSEVKFPSKNFSKYSNQVKDLIKRCLTKDPEERIKINDILKHEWIVKYNN